MATTQPQKRYPFYLGGSASACAACFTHPLDTLKVRMQTYRGENIRAQVSAVRVVKDIYTGGGVRAFYNGLSASLARQLSYSTVRFGTYEALKPRIIDHFDGAALPLYGKIALSGGSGLLGALAGTPFDVVNVRMQASTGTRLYRNVLDGCLQIAKNDGLASLYRGVSANLARAALMTASQIATYDQVKEIAVGRFGFADDLQTRFGATVGTHFACSNVAGLVATTVCSPVDVIKTRVMNAAPGAYRSALHCGIAVVKDEGARALFKGFLPSWVRLGPQTVLTFLFLEQFKGVVDRLDQDDDP